MAMQRVDHDTHILWHGDDLDLPDAQYDKKSATMMGRWGTIVLQVRDDADLDALAEKLSNFYGEVADSLQ